jgi:RND family efflux transporter MFP subunit
MAERDLRANRLSKLRELRERGHASQEELDRAQTELAVAEGRVQELNDQRVIDALEIKKAEALIERRLVRSPINGVITKVHREANEFVTAMSPMVVSVAQLNPLRVTLNVPARVALSFKADSNSRLSFPELDRIISARVELVSPIIDPESGTVRVKFLIDNPDGQLKAGMRCTLPLEPAPLANAR